MPALLALAFLAVPILELYVIIQVGQVIGVGWTILLLLAESALGAWLVRREGRRTWAALRQAVGTGRMPDRELADGALVLVGGTLLLTPGFVTDVVGFFLILPFTRPFARRGLTWLVTRRILRFSGTVRVVRPPGSTAPPGRSGPGPDPGAPGPPPPGHDRRVIRGEVVDGDEDGPPPPP